MGSKAVFWLMAACGLPSAIFGQRLPAAAPIPADPLEIVTGPVAAVDVAGRADVLRLLDRARTNYALRNAGRGYDLKVTFTVSSGGQTAHDGAWEMEDLFDPRQGLRWTAKASDDYAITRISKNGMLYGEETASYIPLRLQEARAALFDPIPSGESLNHSSIRTSTATLNGVSLTCVLLGAGSVRTASPARRWDETEECIDPQSGLLRTHSQVPGRYTAYDYTDALQLAGHVLPRKVTVTEGGKTVTTISVASLNPLPAADAALFVPTEAMKQRGRAIGMGGAQKIARAFGQTMPARNITGLPVCVFGVVTPAGQLAEAHSLDPSNPNSQAAIAAAKQMSFTRTAPAGSEPQQYFVFVIGTFADRQ